MEEISPPGRRDLKKGQRWSSLCIFLPSNDDDDEIFQVFIPLVPLIVTLLNDDCQERCPFFILVKRPLFWA